MTAVMMAMIVNMMVVPLSLDGKDLYQPTVFSLLRKEFPEPDAARLETLSPPRKITRQIVEPTPPPAPVKQESPEEAKIRSHNAKFSQAQIVVQHWKTYAQSDPSIRYLTLEHVDPAHRDAWINALRFAIPSASPRRELDNQIPRRLIGPLGFYIAVDHLG